RRPAQAAADAARANGGRDRGAAAGRRALRPASWCRGRRVASRDGVRLHPCSSGSSPAAQLGPAVQVLRRRWARLRRQPGRVHPAAEESRPPLRGRRDRIVPGRRELELLVEPHVDVPRPTRQLRDPGNAVLHGRCNRLRCQRRRSRGARFVRARQDRLAGNRDRPRDAAQLPRQQAVVVPALRAVALVALALALVPAASAATNPIAPPSIPAAQGAARSTEQQVRAVFLAVPKVKAWLERYPPNPVVDTSYANGVWTVNVFSGRAGEIAT